MKPLFGISILGATLSFLSAASYAQTTITSVPYTISAPGRYIFANNLTYSAAGGVAITVNAHYVSIDLNGHYLYCPTSNNGAVGISASNKANLQVRNGAIVGFARGVDSEYPGSGTNYNFGHLVDGIRFWQNGNAVDFGQSKACVVQNCQIIGPGSMGVYFLSGNGNRATSNVATGLDIGFASTGTDYFDSNYADNCSYGIWSRSATTKLRFNTTTNCTTGVSGGSSEFANDQ
jgi:hypothetical protein